MSQTESSATFRRPDAEAVKLLGELGVATIHEAQGRTGAMRRICGPSTRSAKVSGTAITVVLPSRRQSDDPRRDRGRANPATFWWWSPIRSPRMECSATCWALLARRMAWPA